MTSSLEGTEFMAVDISKVVKKHIITLNIQNGIDPFRFYVF